MFGASGMKVVLTYAFGRLRGLAEALYDKGYELEHTPLIETRAILTESVKAKARELLACPWFVFSSQASIEAWQALGLALPPKHTKLAAVGKQTAETLRALGLQLELIAEPQSAQGLVNCFTAHPEACGPVALPQGNLVLTGLQAKLEAMGFETKALTVYETTSLSWRAGMAEVIVVASPSALAAIPERVATNAVFVSLGETTQAAVKARGWRAVVAASPRVDDLLDALESVLVR